MIYNLNNLFGVYSAIKNRRSISNNQSLRLLQESLLTTLKSLRDKIMEMNQVLYETDYFVMPPDLFEECMKRADSLGIDIDYYLLEFCDNVTDKTEE